MIEILLVVGVGLGLSILAVDGRNLWRDGVRERDEARDRVAEAERLGRLAAVRGRMKQIEVDAGLGPVAPAQADEYDLLILEERVLEADELGDPSAVDRQPSRRSFP